MYICYYYTLVYKINEIFLDINKLKERTINTMVQVISTDLLIKKQLSQNEELKLLSITAADDTGSVSIILKNENIQHAVIGHHVIIRDVKIEMINGYIVLVADENSKIYENKTKSANASFENLEKNFSRVKINTINLGLL
jgi:hypothetical protein